jgi:hypothetical protein
VRPQHEVRLVGVRGRHQQARHHLDLVDSGRRGRRANRPPLESPPK